MIAVTLSQLLAVPCLCNHFAQSDWLQLALERCTLDGAITVGPVIPMLLSMLPAALPRLCVTGLLCLHATLLVIPAWAMRQLQDCFCSGCINMLSVLCTLLLHRHRYQQINPSINQSINQVCPAGGSSGFSSARQSTGLGRQLSMHSVL